MRQALFALVVCVPLAVAGDKTEPTDPKAPKAREVTLDGELPRLMGRFDAPTKVTTEKELEKSLSDKGTREKLLKKVNLKREYLVVFAWAGSGGDRVSFTVSKDGKLVTFNRRFGLTDDLRHHFKVFAVPNGVKYKLAN